MDYSYCSEYSNFNYNSIDCKIFVFYVNKFVMQEHCAKYQFVALVKIARKKDLWRTNNATD